MKAWYTALHMEDNKEETKKSILIVEDELPQLTILKHLFEKEGYNAHTATNGVEGFEKAKMLKPHAVLLDLAMPFGDGVTMLRRMNTDPELSDTPVIILTNLAMDDNLKKNISPKKDRFFTKTNHTLQEIIAYVNTVA